ncbi:ABC transporter substrate-binding protein [Tsuneonella sp. CC-YZS046]|uniref:ABC transporter substrate-binding protein n=1 Tax=Tsuneonella sp. CC-YZS046 TaxID=3042152 RepID=UPI002D7902DF|nr:ABC transporter substrate-binding protein [Tsuneonella sp. CC-YZS046]WRO66275.1 ABC transporter substrate-binding protein [Tsuneonella sp. CC-YZS046]
MRRALAFMTAAAFAAVPASAARPLPRAASFGLCADQMLLMLGDRAQIASVSAQATGPLSFYAGRARGFPANRGAAEEIIASGAKLLLVSDAMDQRSAEALARFGVKVVQVPLANEWAEVEQMTREIAQALGQRPRGEAVIADMRARLTRARAAAPRSDWPTVIYYRPDGGGAGAGTFVDISLTAAGFRNLQREWGPPLWEGVPVERVVLDPPDMFAVSYFDTSTRASATLRRNPVLWGKARTRPVLNVHGKYWNCGSPLLVEAVEQLAAERRRLPGKNRK